MNIQFSKGTGAAGNVSMLFNIYAQNGVLPLNRSGRMQLDFITRRQDALREMNTDFLSLKTAADGLEDTGNWIFNRVVTTTGDFTVTAGADAQRGSWRVRVDQLAAYHRIASDKQANLYDAMGVTGRIRIGTLELELEAADTFMDLGTYLTAVNQATAVSAEQDPLFTSSGGTVTVNGTKIVIPAGTDLAGIRDLVNDTAGAGVKAAVLDNRLYLGAADGSAVTPGDASGSAFAELGLLSPSSLLAQPSPEDVVLRAEDDTLFFTRETGPERLTLGGDLSVWQALGFLDENNLLKNEVQAPQQAVFTVDGTEYRYDTNSIEGLMEDISLELKNETAYARGFSVRTDTSGPRGLIEDFVEKYNTAVTGLNTLLTEGGLFEQDRGMWEIRTEMRRDMRRPVEGLSGSIDTAAGVGLSAKEVSPTVITGYSGVGGDGEEDGPGVLSGDGNINLKKLSSIGIIYDTALGTIEIDYGRLQAALATEPEATRELFTAQADNLAKRVGEQMAKLTASPLGTLATRIRALELEADELEKTNAGTLTADSAYIQARQEYLGLLSLRNIMFDQKESLINTTAYNIFN